MQGTMGQSKFYEHIFHNNPLFLRVLAEYYESFVYNIPQRLCHVNEIETNDNLNLYKLVMQCKNLGGHEEFFCKPLGINSLRNEDFSNSITRIALLPKEHLYHLVLMAGMTICANEITKTVSRKDVEKIRALEDITPYKGQAKYISAYEFSLKKSQMYQNHAALVRQNAMQDASTLGFEGLKIDECIVAYGLWSVLSCVQDGGQNLFLRSLVILDELCAYVPNIEIFSKHFPSSAQSQISPFSSTNNNAWPLLRVLLYKEIACPWEEGWTTFFA